MSTETRPDSRWRDLRYRLERGLYTVGTWPVHRISHDAAGRLGESLSRVAQLGLRKSARLSRESLRRVFPERDERDLARIARASYATFGRVFLEQVSALRFTKQELLDRFEVDGHEHLTRARAMDRGLILLTGHFGAFDISAFPITQEIGTCHTLIRPPSNPYMTSEFERVRQQLDTVLVARTRAGHRLYNLLRKGECIGIALDQRVRPWDGMLIDFLGRPAWTSPVPAFLAWKSRAPVLPLICTPRPGGRYHLEIGEPIVIDDEHYDPAEITRRLSAGLEREILARPELWFWTHDRWRRTLRHRQPSALERIRREADPDGVLAEPAAANVGGPSPRSVVTDDLLEEAGHLVVQGVRSETLAWSRELIESLLARGFAVRAVSAPALVERLTASENDAERRRAMHALDAAPLLVLVDTDEIRDRDAIGRLAELLEHRRLRGSVALLTEVETSNDLAPRLRDFASHARHVAI